MKQKCPPRKLRDGHLLLLLERVKQHSFYSDRAYALDRSLRPD
jgi:hypothetical protein